MSKEEKEKKVTILINNKPYEAPKPAMNGLEIKTLGGGPLDYCLILNVKSPDPATGGDDRQIQDAETVELKSGMHFRIINMATFGR